MVYIINAYYFKMPPDVDIFLLSFIKTKGIKLPSLGRSKDIRFNSTLRFLISGKELLQVGRMVSQFIFLEQYYHVVDNFEIIAHI